MTASLNIPLTKSVEAAISAAQAKARENHQAQFSAGHLLWAILREELDVIPFVENIGKDIFRIRAWADLRIENFPKSARSVETPTADDQVQAILQEAYRLRTLRFESKVTPLLVLEALVTPEVGFTADQIRRLPLTLSEVQDGRQNQSAMTEALGNALSNTANPKNKSNTDQQPTTNTKGNALEKYCEDITSRARQGKIDPVIGRDKELKQLVEILGKRMSPNVIIVGEPGVGKTAIVGGLALNILSDKVPERLKNATVFELDVNGRLVAGAYKGEVEERLKAVLQEIKALGNAILFIDEIHTLLDPNGSVGSGAVNLLKPELARGELTVIGATTVAEFRQYFDADPAFKRRFTDLPILEPNETLAVEMLGGLVSKYEEFHKVGLELDSLPLAVQLAKRYMGEKRLPSSALEVLDVTMSAVAVMNDTNKAEVENLEKEWKEIVATYPNLMGVETSIHGVSAKGVPSKDPKEYDIATKRIQSNMTNRLSHLLTQRLDADQESASFAENFEQKLAKLKEWTAEPKTVVLGEDIAATIAYLTNIPMGKIQVEEQRKLMIMETLLEKRVLGQEKALKTVAEAMRRARAGLRESNKPSAAFFFLGPTGTGKTELCKALADFLFSDPNALIRFDMSEFKEEHSVALLYGSPPGYIGYKEGGLLVNKIRQRPYSVVLFDEIEKAHQSVYDIFLQILDEGVVHDKQGNKGDFTKAIVIFTSNIGSQWIVDQFGKGHTPTSDELRGIMSEAKMPNGAKAFRPEFLGRGMRLIPFAPITETVATNILGIHLNNFAKLLSRQDIKFSYTKEAQMELVSSGFSPIYGARPLKDTIEERIATPMSDKIIDGEIKKGSSVEVDWDKKKATFLWNTNDLETIVTKEKSSKNPVAIKSEPPITEEKITETTPVINQESIEVDNNQSDPINE
jgi:ATP-dependent Clp protease ATP-binding subunit ClpB